MTLVFIDQAYVILVALPETRTQSLLARLPALNNYFEVDLRPLPSVGILGNSERHPFDLFQFPTGSGIPFFLGLFGDPSQETPTLKTML